MFCTVCKDKSLKFSPSQSNSKRETWVCTTKGCGYREEYPLAARKECAICDDWATTDGRGGPGEVAKE